MEREKLIIFPSSQYITIDSKDRNQTTLQPWNQFTLQKPGAILDSFAKRLMVSEVRFPWYIPNITPNNNQFYIATDIFGTNTKALITVPPGFYSPANLVTRINALLSSASLTDPPVLSYSNNQYTFTSATFSPITPFQIWWFNPVAYASTPSITTYLSSASLMRTLGFDYDQVSGSQVSTSGIVTGQPTETLYTSYIDIVSQRLTRFQKVRDGDSAIASQGSTICRLYLADEASTPLLSYAQIQNAGTGGYGSFPFVIHRQFKNAKAIAWNPDTFVDYLDISVLDEYNNVVPLIPQPLGTTGGASSFNAQYPDFQITLVCLE